MTPILSALRKHRAGVVLIALQIALTLAIVCNAIFIIADRVATIRRPTGIDEQNLFLLSQRWVGAFGDDPASAARLDAMAQEDLAALRRMPDVVSASPVNALPLSSSSWTGTVSQKPGDGHYDGDSRGAAYAAYYLSDEGIQPTLGLRVTKGRFFTASEVKHFAAQETFNVDVVVISSALEKALFHGENSLGRTLFMDGGTHPVTVVGVVERMQAPVMVRNYPWNVAILPARVDSPISRYAVRTKPGRLDAVLKAAPATLFRTNPMRVIDDDAVKSFARIRRAAYESDVGMAILMVIVCLILLCVTAAGIVGLTSFWVSQRQKQIGIRRALGARRIDILHYFHLENLAIAGGGAALGVVLAVTLNFWLMRYFGMERLPLPWVWTGVLLVMVLSQLAVFVPARRASRIAPVVATRAG